MYCLIAANQFIYDRSHANRSLSSFVTEDEIPEEDEDMGDSEAAAAGSGDSNSDSFTYQKPKLSDIEQGYQMYFVIVSTV